MRLFKVIVKFLGQRLYFVLKQKIILGTLTFIVEKIFVNAQERLI